MPNEPKLSHSRGRPPTQHAQERSRCTATEKRGGSSAVRPLALEADAIAVWIFEIPLFHAVVSNNRLLHINELGAGECKPPSISDPQKVLPFAKFALEAHALRYLERCDDAPLDLLAGFASSFAGSPILPAGLIEVGYKSVALDGRGQTFANSNTYGTGYSRATAYPVGTCVRQSKERFAHSGR